MIIRRARIEDAPEIAHIHIQTWLTTYRGIIPDSYLDALPAREEERRAYWEDQLSVVRENQFLYVAQDEEAERLAGFVVGGPTRYPDLPYTGELYAIYILQEYQQRGLGRLLTQALAGDLLEAGMAEMLLWVLEKNLASRRFYEILGGKYVKSNTFEVDGTTIAECAYAWNDLSQLG